MVRLMGLENSKAVHHIRVSEDGAANFTYIGWSRNFSGKRKSLTGKKEAKSWQDLLPSGGDWPQEEDSPDLPHELTFLEVDSALPKISPLPVSGGSG